MIQLVILFVLALNALFVPPTEASTFSSIEEWRQNMAYRLDKFSSALVAKGANQAADQVNEYISMVGDKAFFTEFFPEEKEQVDLLFKAEDELSQIIFVNVVGSSDICKYKETTFICSHV